MTIERPSLFNAISDLSGFALFLLLLFVFSTLRLYGEYRELTRFDDAEINATVTGQYIRTKKGRSYTVITARLDNGIQCRVRASALLRDLSGRQVRLWLGTKRISFYGYVKGFYTYGHVLAVSRTKAWRYRVADAVKVQHDSPQASELFAALFTATPLSWSVRQKLSQLGISHLLAISGFHFGLLAGIATGVFYLPYRWVQHRFFPWRNRRRDLFWLSAVVLILYALFLGMVPSVLRSVAMLLIGFILYDRGLKIVSMQTLTISVAVLIAFWPPLLFSMGFWLSVGGVFYLFLFLMMETPKNSTGKFIAIHLWIYAMMLPISLALFGIFSPYHPLSVFWSMAFILFYPVALLAHLAGLGGVLDAPVGWLLELPAVAHADHAPALGLIVIFGLLSILAVRWQRARVLLAVAALAVFIEAVYEVAQP